MTQPYMNAPELKKLLDDIPRARVAILGDFCLDAYWFEDVCAAEISLETGLPTRPVRRQRYTLGGAGNIAVNLAEMGVTQIRALGVVGPDPFGTELLRLLRACRVETSLMQTQADDWSTHVYIKPHREDREQNRLDFGNFNRLSDDSGERLLSGLEQALPELDIVIINEQVLSGIHAAPVFRSRLGALIAGRSAPLFLLDSRHYSDCYAGTIRKLNDHEAARLCGTERAADCLVLAEEARAFAGELYQRWQQPLFITRGARGCLVRDREGLHEIFGLQILGRTDPVGAGDSMLAGIAAALAAGRAYETAAELGNFVAGVSVQVLCETGAASPAQIMAIGADADYVYRPELAEDPRRARILPGTEIELVTASPDDLRITHAIFDHDGTISTLRQGWEEVMTPMMVRAVLGPRFQDADEALYHKVAARVREFIDKTTGIRTIAQMELLVELVREFKCVPENEIKAASGYKQVYNEALLGLVRARIAKFERLELDTADFTIKGAFAFLERLRAAGLKLYLASGTDQQDVEREALVLGYAGLFNGGIYGAVRGVSVDAKKIVLERILDGIGRDQARHIAAFGDGPVEIRETHKRGGLTVGLASDEVRRFGLNLVKRARLIKAGADLVVPDFSQAEKLLALLRLQGGLAPAIK